MTDTDTKTVSHTDFGSVTRIAAVFEECGWVAEQAHYNKDRGEWEIRLTRTGYLEASGE